MALPNLEEPERLTSADKFQRLKPRALVEVKLIARTGLPPTWERARIKETNKGGAFCRTERGKDGFYNWSEVRPCEVDPKPPSLTAPLGDVARGGLRALPPFLDTEPAKPPPPPPPVIEADAQTVAEAALLISHEDLRNMQAKPKRQKHIHQITPIASLFREQRLKRGWGQIETADRLSSGELMVLGDQISRIELGKQPPSDDILIAFGSVFAIDLDVLITLRDGETKPAPLPEPRRSPVTVIPSPVVAPRPAPVVAIPARVSPTLPAPEPPDAAERMGVFTDQLMGLAPPPLDRDKRIQWFRLASQLFRLSEA